MMYFAPQLGQSKAIGSDLSPVQRAGIFCIDLCKPCPLSVFDLYQDESQRIACLHCTERYSTMRRDGLRNVFLYSHGEYRHCTAKGSAAGTGLAEGSAAGTGRRECTRVTPNVQQWLVPSQIRCALENLARASPSVMQAGEPLAGDT